MAGTRGSHLVPGEDFSRDNPWLCPPVAFRWGLGASRAAAEVGRYLMTAKSSVAMLIPVATASASTIPSTQARTAPKPLRFDTPRHPSVESHMSAPARLPAIFVDVDDTLVRSFGSKRIPISAMVERVLSLHAEGAELYCWSSGGGEYARKSANELGLGHCFRAFLPKPNVLIDDAKPSGWPDMTQVHPNTASSENLEALRSRLGW
ncbi:MAG: hypothetical protein KC492_28580 [Myxococcales bacterium]|nr:hypothetical protein [Myxococcales bacterium]